MVSFGKKFVVAVAFGQRWLYSRKVVLFGQSNCIYEEMLVFAQKWLYSGKSGCIRAK